MCNINYLGLINWCNQSQGSGISWDQGSAGIRDQPGSARTKDQDHNQDPCYPRDQGSSRISQDRGSTGSCQGSRSSKDQDGDQGSTGIRHHWVQRPRSYPGLKLPCNQGSSGISKDRGSTRIKNQPGSEIS